MKKSKSLAEQIAELDDPAPKDLDPEAIDETHGDDDNDSASGDQDVVDVREHYVDVGESKLRKKEDVSLGPQYDGARVSRDALLDNDDEDDAAADDPFAPKHKSDAIDNDSNVSVEDKASLNGLAIDEEGNEDSDTSNVISRNGDLPETDDSDASGSASASSEDDSESSMASQDDDDDEDDDDNDNDEAMHTDTGTDRDASQRTALRRMMQEEQKAVTATISKAAKADADKGAAVKQQRQTFDALLNTRIRLQKAIIATNSMPLVIAASKASTPAASPTPVETIASVESAALDLWNTLTDLRHSIPTTSTAQKRKRSTLPQPATSSTPLKALWDTMQGFETTQSDIRASTLDKWALKTRPAAPPSTLHRLNPTATAPQSLSSNLRGQLADPARLIARARTPRSCAPLQASSTLSITESPIFDDADFYQQLLRELLEQRAESADGVAAAAASSAILAPSAAAREAKVRRRDVDTRASKGRKMRFTVQEKIRDFMAPEDRGAWERRQVEELCRGLVGAARGGLDEEVPPMQVDRHDIDVDDDAVDAGEDALRLFRS
ncbi:MAG: hypothetical protein M1825_005523 [Sarcosagium campestre]|nr:MAG: hypothetical protein M1825_005523 [Sarcosagium campestre]